VSVTTTDGDFVPYTHGLYDGAFVRLSLGNLHYIKGVSLPLL